MSENGRTFPPVQGLDLFHAMYVVGLALGLEQISTALYAYLSKSSIGDVKCQAITNVLLFFAVMLLIIRFLWSTGNIRRAWERNEKEPSRVARFFVIIHLPSLLIQGALVLFVCMAFVDRVDKGINAYNVAWWLIGVTAWNAIWLVFLTRAQRGLKPESFWILNNILFVVAGSALMFAELFGILRPDIAIVVFAALSIASSMADMYVSATEYLSTMGR